MGQYYHPVALNPHNNSVIGWVSSHDFGSGLKLMEHSWMKNPFVNAVENLLAEGGQWEGKPIVWAGDYADSEDGTEKGKNLYDFCEDEIKIKPLEVKPLKYRILINHTKKQYVDKSKIPADGDGWRIHPLPLLTCEGNGQGGGDYFGKDPNGLIGSWARDVIGVSKRNIPEGYEEVVFDLVE